MDRAKLIEGAVARGQKFLTDGERNMVRIRAEMIAAGANGTRGIILQRGALEEAFAKACEEAALYIGEAAGSGFPTQDDALREVLTALKGEAIKIGARFDSPSSRAFPPASRATLWAPLDENLEKAVNETLNDCHVGIAGGRKMKDSDAVNITNNAGQVAVNSPNATQSVGGDINNFGQSAIVDLNKRLAAIEAIVLSGDLSEEARDDILDEMKAVAGEAAKKEPDEGLLKRGLKRVIRLGEQYGLPIAAELTKAAIAQKLGLSNG